MDQTGIVTIIILIANLIGSYLGLRSNAFFEAYSFKIDAILIHKDYKRIITAGFLHLSWVHLLFNMISLYCFSYALESQLGGLNFLLLYMLSLVGGNLFALYIHRNHDQYCSVGASGAISGIIFAAIVYFPGLKIGLFGLPVLIPGWVYGILFVLYSIYGIQSQRDNVAHEVHLSGGITGLIAIFIMYPQHMAHNYFAALLILIPSLIFIYLIISRPAFLLLERPYLIFKSPKPYQTLEDEYNGAKRNKEKELDEILDQINEKGFDSLTQKEKEKLEELSKQN